MPDWIIGALSTLLGTCLGAGIVYTLLKAHLAAMEESQREALARQHRELTQSFVDGLKSHVTEIRGQAQVRLLGAIFNLLAHKALPVYYSGQELCVRWRAATSSGLLLSMRTELDALVLRAREMVSQLEGIIDGDRYQDEVCLPFRQSMVEGSLVVDSLRRAVDALRAIPLDGQHDAPVPSGDCIESVNMEVVRFGKWVKQCMEDAARMQNDLLAASTPAEQMAAPETQEADLDLVL